MWSNYQINTAIQNEIQKLTAIETYLFNELNNKMRK